jgi:hypothetical protein
MTASLTYFASDRRLGSHELKGGFENFVDTRIGANAQSSTGYVFLSDFKSRAACRCSTRMVIPADVRAGRVRACSGGFPTAAPSSTRRRCRPTCRIAGWPRRS